MTYFLWMLLAVVTLLWSLFLGLIVGDILKAIRLESEHVERERRRKWHGR